MIIETCSDKETFALGEKLGKAAKPGQIYTLLREWQRDLG